MEAKIEDIHGVFSSVAVLRKASFAVLFALKAKFLAMLLLTKSVPQREGHQIVDALLGVVEAKVSKPKMRDIGLRISLLERIEELLRRAQHFFGFKRWNQKDFPEAAQGSAKRVLEEVERVMTILAKVKTRRFLCIDCSTKPGALYVCHIGAECIGRIGQQSLVCDQLTATKLNEQKWGGMPQVWSEILALNTGRKTARSRTGSDRILCELIIQLGNMNGTHGTINQAQMNAERSSVLTER